MLRAHRAGARWVGGALRLPRVRAKRAASRVLRKDATASATHGGQGTPPATRGRGREAENRQVPANGLAQAPTA
jgi:hypothetical protein